MRRSWITRPHEKRRDAGGHHVKTEAKSEPGDTWAHRGWERPEGPSQGSLSRASVVLPTPPLKTSGLQNGERMSLGCGYLLQQL